MGGLALFCQLVVGAEYFGFFEVALIEFLFHFGQLVFERAFALVQSDQFLLGPLQLRAEAIKRSLHHIFKNLMDPKERLAMLRAKRNKV